MDMRTTRLSLLGTQDFYWWVTLARNEHLIAAASSNLVRINREDEHTVNRIVACGSGAIGYDGAHNGPYGAIVTTDELETTVKILGPVTVTAAGTIAPNKFVEVENDGTVTVVDTPTRQERIIGTVLYAGTVTGTAVINIDAISYTPGPRLVPAVGKVFSIISAVITGTTASADYPASVDFGTAAFASGELTITYPDDSFTNNPVPQLSVLSGEAAIPVLVEHSSTGCKFVFRNNTTYLLDQPGSLGLLVVGEKDGV